MEKVKLFLNRLTNNWKMKLVSLVLALFLWNSVIMNTDPLVSRITDPIPVTLIGVEQLTAKGLAIANESSDYLQSVRVTVLMSRSQSKLFNQDDVQVMLDLSKISTTGEQTIRITAYTTDGTIDKVSPESFTVQVDQKKSKIVPIEYETIGTLEDGYFNDEPIVEPTSLQVTGPSSVVDTVDRAVFTIDLTGRTSSISLPKELSLVDVDGNIISSDTLATSVDSAIFEMNIMPRKEIKILGENCISGADKLPKGYQIEDIEVYPEVVEVTGSAELLEGLTSLDSEVIDIAGKKEDVYTSIKLLIPDGIKILSADSVSLIIRIGEIMEKVTYEEKTVQLRNIPPGMSVENFDEIRTVELLVPYNTVSTLTSSHVKLYIDLSGLTEGEHQLKIQCEVPEEFRVSEITIPDDTATVIMVNDN